MYNPTASVKMHFSICFQKYSFNVHYKLKKKNLYLRLKKEQTEILNSPLKKFIISEDKHVHNEKEKNNRKHEFTFKALFPPQSVGKQQ